MIKLKRISKFYRGTETVSVGIQRVSAEFTKGDFVAITGESGSGKSTLLNVISGLDTYDEGELLIYGEETSHFTQKDFEKYRLEHISFIFQDYNILDSYTVYQNVILALELSNYPKKDRKKRALELIDRVGLSSHKNHKGTKLSGGQKQRVVIARALAKDSSIIAADEPTGNLDSETTREIMALLYEISKDKLIIVVTHDFGEVKEYATRRIRMSDGRIIEDAKTTKPLNLSNQENVTTKERDAARINPIFLAFRNALAAPKRLIFLVLLQFFVVGILFLIYGSFLSNLNGINNAALSNRPGASFLNYGRHSLMSDNHIILAKKDNSLFTLDEMKDFKKNSSVIEVVNQPLNFFSDTNSGGVIVSSVDGSEVNNVQIDHEVLLEKSKYRFWGETPTYFEKDLITGIYNYNGEVGVTVSNSMNYKIGQNITLPFLQKIVGSEGLSIKVTGLVQDSQNKIYFPKEYFSDFTLLKLSGLAAKSISLSLKVDNYYRSVEVPLGDIAINTTIKVGLNEFLVNQTAANKLFNVKLNEQVNYSNLTIRNVFTNSENRLTSKGNITDNDKAFTISALMYNQILDEHLQPYEVVLVFSDSFAAEKYFNSLDGNNFYIFYHNNIENLALEAMKFIFSIVMYLIIFLVAVILFTIIHFVTRNMMEARKTDFAVLRTLGSSKQNIGMIVIIEQLMVTITAFVLVLLSFQILSYTSFTFFNILRNFSWLNYGMVFILVFILAVFLGERYNKKIFDASVITALKVTN